MLTNFKEWYDKSGGKSIITSLRYNETLKDELVSRTSFLSKTSSVSERLYVIINNISKQPKCPYCDKNLVFYKLNKGYSSTCRNKDCVKKHRSVVNKNSSKKINWKESKEKSQATCLKRYGGKHAWSKNSSSRETYYNTMEELYGVKHALQNLQILKQQQQTTIDRHGTTNILNLEKTKQTILNKYGVDNVMKNETIKNKVSETLQKRAKEEIEKNIKKINKKIISYGKSYLTLECLKCKNTATFNRNGVNYFIRNEIDPCPVCNPKQYEYRSNCENELYLFIQSLDIKKIELNKKYMLQGLELDIYLPDLKVGFEFNGIYWHSELFKDKLYHVNKKQRGSQNDINVINIWEDDWKDEVKNQIIKSRIKNILGLSEKVFARKTTVEIIDAKQAREFLNKNHIQGYVNSSVHLGIIYKNELLAVMTFASNKRMFRKIEKNEIELTRFATKCGYTLVGGAAKLLNKFLKEFKLPKLVSYANLDISNGELYEKLGFKKTSISEPGFWWWKGDKRYHRSNFMKFKLVKTGFDPNKTAIEIMNENGYARIFNSGNFKFEL